MDAAVQTLSPLTDAIGTAVQLVFPSLALGLACFLAVLELLWVMSRNRAFRDLSLFWTNIFGVCFVLAVAAMLALGRALGWTWAGPEVSMAILAMTSLVLALVLGYRRMGAPLRAPISLATAASLLATAAWVSALEAAAYPVDGAFPERLARHTLGAFLVTALAVGAISAWRLLRRPDEAASAMALRMSVGMLAISATLRFLIGDMAWRPPVSAASEDAWALPIEAGLGAGVVWLALWAGWLAERRGGPERSRTFLRACLAMGAVGTAAVFAGWVFGRIRRGGPWGAPELSATSFEAIALWAAYALLFGGGGYLILRLAVRPFDEPSEAQDTR